MVVTVREVTRADDAAIGELLGELGYPSATDLQTRLGSWLDVSERRLLVAVVCGDVVGMLGLVMTPRLESDGWWAQVVALVVAERYRGQGVGRRLVERAEALSEEAGCDTLFINSSRRRTDAHALFVRLGYRDRCQDHAQFVRSMCS